VPVRLTASHGSRAHCLCVALPVVAVRTGVIDDGIIEMRPKKIARAYARGWLSIDVVSCLPIPYITQIMAALEDDSDASGQGNTTKLFKILRLLRLAKLLRLGRLKKIIKRHEEEMEGLMGVLKVAGSVLAMSYTCHLVACGWYFVGDDVVPGGGLDTQPGWISSQMDDVWNATQDRPEVSFSTRYITSYYWAITTISTVGFGDITGNTDGERLYSIMAEMFGCLMFAVLIGALGSMMVGQKLLEEKVDKQLSELREFMQVKEIPRELRIKIRRFMETLYEQKSGFDESDVLAQLPPAMAHELLTHMYHKIISQVPMFNNLEEGAITRLCALIKPYTAMNGDLIYKRGEVGREIFIIIGGTVEIQYTATAEQKRVFTAGEKTKRNERTFLSHLMVCQDRLGTNVRHTTQNTRMLCWLFHCRVDLRGGLRLRIIRRDGRDGGGGDPER
jgi:hypothetical protein